MLDLDFGDTPEKLKREYLDIYEGIQSEILSTNWFDENSDLSTLYLMYNVPNQKQQNKIGGTIPNIRTRAHIRKSIRWNRMPSTIRHKSW